MKIFAFIMAVIVLAMSVMPCADGATAMSKTKTELKNEAEFFIHLKKYFQIEL